ncbi:MAG: hypothetical protein J0M07_07380 [Anaerolineae bacterium]|nr:hypothetical protein [Anaerolineae bacterium]
MPAQVSPRRVITVDDSEMVTRAPTPLRRAPAPPPPPRPVAVPIRANPQLIIPVDDSGSRVRVLNNAARSNYMATSEASADVMMRPNDASHNRSESRMMVQEFETRNAIRSAGGDDDYLVAGSRNQRDNFQSRGRQIRRFSNMGSITNQETLEDQILNSSVVIQSGVHGRNSDSVLPVLTASGTLFNCGNDLCIITTDHFNPSGTNDDTLVRGYLSNTQDPANTIVIQGANGSLIINETAVRVVGGYENASGATMFIIRGADVSQIGVPINNSNLVPLSTYRETVEQQGTVVYLPLVSGDAQLDNANIELGSLWDGINPLYISDSPMHDRLIVQATQVTGGRWTYQDRVTINPTLEVHARPGDSGGGNFIMVNGQLYYVGASTSITDRVQEGQIYSQFIPLARPE